MYKGDGTTIYLKEIQKIAEIVAGELNAKRDLIDSSLEPNVPQFYKPYSISINKDGIIFIADYNIIWMLNGSEPAKRVLELNIDKPYKYHLANEPNNGNLYFTDQINRQILRIKYLDGSIYNKNDLKSNFEIKIVSGKNSSINYPKSIAFDNNGIIYFIDGSFVKSLSKDGKVINIIGQDEEVCFS